MSPFLFVELFSFVFCFVYAQTKIKGVDMKIIRIISFAICMIMLFQIVCFADEELDWYIIKRGNSAPGFPKNASDVIKYGGIYIDEGCEERGDKKLYLTFDAGYENGNIEKIMDVMKEEGVTGAFFILSNLIIKNPDIVKRMAGEGHLVCNHTYNHKNIARLSNSEIISNLERLEKLYRETTGKDMDKIFRFPEGKYSIRTLKLLNENGYKTAFWSMAYDDWDNSRQMNPDIAKNKLLSTTHNGAIILLHPTSDTNVIILRDLIREWKNQGYTFGSLRDI